MRNEKRKQRKKNLNHKKNSAIPKAVHPTVASSTTTTQSANPAMNIKNSSDSKKKLVDKKTKGGDVTEIKIIKNKLSELLNNSYESASQLCEQIAMAFSDESNQAPSSVTGAITKASRETTGEGNCTRTPANSDEPKINNKSMIDKAEQCLTQLRELNEIFQCCAQVIKSLIENCNNPTYIQAQKIFQDDCLQLEALISNEKLAESQKSTETRQSVEMHRSITSDKSIASWQQNASQISPFFSQTMQRINPSSSNASTIDLSMLRLSLQEWLKTVKILSPSNMQSRQLS